MSDSTKNRQKGFVCSKFALTAGKMFCIIYYSKAVKYPIGLWLCKAAKSAVLLKAA